MQIVLKSLATSTIGPSERMKSVQGLGPSGCRGTKGFGLLSYLA